MDGFDWTTIKIDAKTVGNEIKVKLRDIDNVELTLFIKIERERAGLELLLYTKVCIINYTGLNFELSTSSRNIRRRVAGQKLVGRQILMTNKASKLIINYKGASSGKLHTKQIGYKEDFRLKIREDPTINITSIYDFVFSTSINLVSNDSITSNLFSKNIKIYPKYVIVNHLDTPLRYRQHGNMADNRILESNEREILYWPNDQFGPFISIKTFDKGEDPDTNDDDSQWSWTQGIPVKDVGITSVQSRC